MALPHLFLYCWAMTCKPRKDADRKLALTVRWTSRFSVDGVDLNRQLAANDNTWPFAAYSQDELLADLQSQPTRAPSAGGPNFL